MILEFIATGETGQVFSAHAEVFPAWPRPWWGCDGVFSAHAEVFPRRRAGLMRCLSVLRSRGGISALWVCDAGVKVCSPLTRRYFPAERGGRHSRDVFSALPPRCANPASATGVLRSRGGISEIDAIARREALSSPLTRRYFRFPTEKVRELVVFSAHAEVFHSRHRRASAPTQRPATKPAHRTRCGRHRAKPHSDVQRNTLRTIAISSSVSAAHCSRICIRATKQGKPRLLPLPRAAPPRL